MRVMKRQMQHSAALRKINAEAIRNSKIRVDTKDTKIRT